MKKKKIFLCVYDKSSIFQHLYISPPPSPELGTCENMLMLLTVSKNNENNS